MGEGAGEHGRQVDQEPPASRLDRDRGQCATQVGLMERHCSQSGIGHVQADPAEFQLVRCGHQHEHARRGAPVGGQAWIAETELNRGMSCLACLGRRRQI